MNDMPEVIHAALIPNEEAKQNGYWNENQDNTSYTRTDLFDDLTQQNALVHDEWKKEEAENDALHDQVADLTKQLSWIRVDERLPEDSSRRYLLRFESHGEYGLGTTDVVAYWSDDHWIIIGQDVEESPAYWLLIPT